MPDASTLALAIQGITDDLMVLHFEGHEGMSQLFEFEITFSCADALTFADVVRKAATLTMHVDQDTPRVVHGIVSRLEQENPQAKTTQYRLTLVPRAWQLLHRMNCRIFQDMTAPKIVDAVLTGAGLTTGDDYKLNLQATYTSRDYCVQYRESDWDFISRLLEEEGIFYSIDNGGETDVIVIADAVSGYAAIAGAATLNFRPRAGAMGGTLVPGDHVLTFQYAEQIRSGKTTTRDWNFLKPALLLESAGTGAVNADLEIYDFPGEYQLKADGDTLATVRIGEQSAGIQMAGGESSCSQLAPAHTFTLAEHPRESFNLQYVVTRVAHRGTNAEAHQLADDGDVQPLYENEFEVIPASTLFRPPRVTRRPHIHGVQTATVVGPSGDEIYVDANCRVKVQFHWDRLGKNDDKSSCWVRVAQSWASASFGAMFIPRIKDEVVVTFLEGDPDQPLIVGSIYHGTNVPPYTLPDNKTRSTIKSNTSPGGGGSNELRFEDKKGSEEVFLHAQKDWTIGVENDKNQNVGHDETHHVVHDRTKNVDNDQTATIGHDDTLTVKNDQTMTVQHDQALTVQNDRSVTVQNDHTEAVSGNQKVTITKAQTVAISDKQDITVSKTRSLTVTGDVSETFQAKLTVSVTGDVSETMSAKRTVSLTGDHAESIGGKESITVSGDSVETVSGKKTFTVTGNVTITSGSSTVTIKPSGEISIAGVKMSIDASGPLEISGATVDVKSQGPATFKGAAVTSSADAAYTLKGATLTLDGQMINVG
ncbi:MAG TPA: type VI secretion system tip protein TssI/VgrG [Polyangiaceae bacterium]|jgi:type VI secretion system secreted protein VgrG